MNDCFDLGGTYLDIRSGFRSWYVHICLLTCFDRFCKVRTNQKDRELMGNVVEVQPTLTRWRSAVRARTGLPYFSITSRVATAFRCCFATWFASHLFLHIKDRLALVRPRAVVSVTPYSASRRSRRADRLPKKFCCTIHDLLRQPNFLASRKIL